MFSLQALHSEVLALEPTHTELTSLGTALCPTAPEERVRQLKDELETLQRRLNVQNEVIPQRLDHLTAVISLQVTHTCDVSDEASLT